MRIVLNIDVPSPQQTRAAARPKASLKERVEYALDQIIAGTSSKQRAIEFCREAFDYLDSLEHPTPEQQSLKEELKPVINEYGMYHKGSSQRE